jgi:hypothetical protein
MGFRHKIKRRVIVFGSDDEIAPGPVPEFRCRGAAYLFVHVAFYFVVIRKNNQRISWRRLVASVIMTTC